MLRSTNTLASEYIIQERTRATVSYDAVSQIVASFSTTIDQAVVFARARQQALGLVAMQLDDEQKTLDASKEIQLKYRQLLKKVHEATEAHRKAAEAHTLLQADLVPFADPQELLALKTQLEASDKRLLDLKSRLADLRAEQSSMLRSLSGNALRFPEYLMLPGLESLALLPPNLRRRFCVLSDAIEAQSAFREDADAGPTHPKFVTDKETKTRTFVCFRLTPLDTI